MQHGQINVWAVSQERKLTMINGSLIQKYLPKTADGETPSFEVDDLPADCWNIGNVEEVQRAIGDVLAGGKPTAEVETTWHDRWHKVRISLSIWTLTKLMTSLGPDPSRICRRGQRRLSRGNHHWRPGLQHRHHRREDEDDPGE